MAQMLGRGAIRTCYGSASIANLASEATEVDVWALSDRGMCLRRDLQRWTWGVLVRFQRQCHVMSRAVALGVLTASVRTNLRASLVTTLLLTGAFVTNVAFTTPAAAETPGQVTFSGPALAVGDEPRAVAVGDFDGDGDVDLAVANRLSDNVSVLLGDGSGDFGAATNFAVGDSPNSVAVGQFDGDGDVDLVVANGGSDNVSVLLGDGSGGFAPATIC